MDTLEILNVGCFLCIRKRNGEADCTILSVTYILVGLECVSGFNLCNIRPGKLALEAAAFCAEMHNVEDGKMEKNGTNVTVFCMCHQFLH